MQLIQTKRVRTSIADVRLEGRPSHLSVQRSSSIIQERERDVPKPSSSLALQVEDKESMPLRTKCGLVHLPTLSYAHIDIIPPMHKEEN
jgi:hypothetical protein